MTASRVRPWILCPVTTSDDTQGNWLTFTLKEDPFAPNLHLTVCEMVVIGKHPTGSVAKDVASCCNVDECLKISEMISSAYKAWH